MYNRRSIIGLSVILGALPMTATPETAQADPPSLLSMFRKRSDSASVYQLKAEHGPWLILAASLSGDDAKTKADFASFSIKNSSPITM